MDSLTDFILRYCVIFGRRFFPKEKIIFLRVFSKEVMQFGYLLDAKFAKLKLTKKKYQNYYNGYIGDLDKAEVIICTYYDTGVKNFNLTNEYAFNSSFNKKSYFISILPIVCVFIVSIILNALFFIPQISDIGLLSLPGVMLLLSTLVPFYYVVRYHAGIPNRKNFIRNSSSLVLMLNLMKKLDSRSRKNVAFVLLDGGNTNSYGLRMLESFSKNILTKKIIFLDSIGNSENIQIFSSDTSNLNLKNIDFNKGEINTQFKNYILITSGELDMLNRVKIIKANTSGDDSLAVDIIEKHTETLFNLCCDNILNECNKMTSKNNRK